MCDYRLIVIGAGPGGYTAALRAGELGLRTAIVESADIGGTCLNRGCVPTKALLHASEAFNLASRGAELGITLGEPRVDLPRMFARKQEVVEQLRGGVEGLLRRAKVDVLHGTARTSPAGNSSACQTDTPKVRVTSPDGTSATYTAENVIVATGSVPARPPIPGLDLPGVLTSDELLEGADRLYESIVVIGGGVIGVELATFYADLGTQVTIVEGLDRLLPTLDRELGQGVASILKARGARICTGSMVKGIEQGEDGSLAVRFSSRNAPSAAGADVDPSVVPPDETALGEVVLCAVGRVPFLDGLFDDGLAPERSGRALKVDERFATSVRGVYAIGDVSSPVQLAHVAAAQGTVCVEMIAGVEPTIDLGIVPSCVYCRPEIASVGLSEAEAKAAGLQVKTGKCVLGGNARTVISAPGRSFMKVVADAQDGAIVGAQLMCSHASDMISQVSVAIANRMTPLQLLRAMRPHPTFEESLGDALRDLAKKLA